GGLPSPRELSAREVHDAALRKDTVVLDTRAWDDFRAAHLPGSLSTVLDKTFPTVAGSYVEEHERVALLVEPERVEEAVRLLVRVGVDHVIGFARPGVIDELRAGGAALGAIEEIDAATLRAMLERGERPALLDVRRATEHAAGRITETNYANVAHTSLRDRMDEVPEGSPLIVHCAGGVRSARAASYLARKGYTPINLKGGFAAWLKAARE